jgi:hypothetical protein
MDDWLEEDEGAPIYRTVVELPDDAAEVMNDERVQRYIREKLQPTADELDKLAKAFFCAASPAPVEGYLRARATYARQLAREGLSASQILIQLTPSEKQIRDDLEGP